LRNPRNGRFEKVQNSDKSVNLTNFYSEFNFTQPENLFKEIDYTEILPTIEKRLKSFLSQPKAQKWCRYEWFYSPIDEVLLKHNEFQDCLDEIGYSRVDFFIIISFTLFLKIKKIKI